MKPGNPDNRFAKLVIVSIIFGLLVSTVYIFRQNEGNKFLSGHESAQWVKEADAHAVYDELKKALDLQVNELSSSSRRPHYVFGYVPGWKQPSRWWTLVGGEITSSYPTIPITDELLTNWRRNLLATGWKTELSAQEYKKDINSAAELRQKEIERIQRDALRDLCIKSDYCQEQKEKALRKANDRPLDTHFQMLKGDGIYFAYLHMDNDLSEGTAKVRLRLAYSCTTVNC